MPLNAQISGPANSAGNGPMAWFAALGKGYHEPLFDGPQRAQKGRPNGTPSQKAARANAIILIAHAPT